MWPPPWPPRRPLDTKRVSQASFWTPFGSRFGTPCENLILYLISIKKTPFGPARVPNKTLTCIHNASETTFCAFFSPPWRPRGAPGLKTELPDGPEASQKAPQNPSKSPQNQFLSAILYFRASWGAPPTKNDQKWTQNGCKCIALGASSLDLFGLTFRLKIVIGDKTLKHTLHAKHHCMSVDHLSGHLGT